MKTVKRIALYASSALIVAVIATIVDGLALIGYPTSVDYYPAERLCASLQPGMELRDVEARVYGIGIPQSIAYHSNQLDVFGRDSGCILEIDPTTKRLAMIHMSGPSSIF
jgi:hypothetical protein